MSIKKFRFNKKTTADQATNQEVQDTLQKTNFELTYNTQQTNKFRFQRISSQDQQQSSIRTPVRIRKLKPIRIVQNLSKSQNIEQQESLSYSEFIKLVDSESSQIKQKLYINLENYIFKSFVALDFETANRHNHICEIGICKVEDSQIVDTYDEYIQPPGNYYDSRWTEIHGISAKTTKHSRFFNEAWPEIFEKYIKGNLIVCHNAKSADMHFLYRNLLRYELDFPIFPFIDTCSIAYCFINLPANERQGQYRLNALCERYSIEQKQHHNALDDACCCAKLFMKEIEEFSLTSYFDIRNASLRNYDEFPKCKLQTYRNKPAYQKTKRKTITETDSEANIVKVKSSSKVKNKLEQEIPTSNIVVLNWSMYKKMIWAIDLTKIQNFYEVDNQLIFIRPSDFSFYYPDRHSKYVSIQALEQAPTFEEVYQKLYEELNNKVVLVCREQYGPLQRFVQSLKEANIQMFDAQFFYAFEIFKKCFMKKEQTFSKLRYLHNDFDISVSLTGKFGEHYNSRVSSIIYRKLIRELNLKTFNEIQEKYNISSGRFTEID